MVLFAFRQIHAICYVRCDWDYWIWWACVCFPSATLAPYYFRHTAVFIARHSRSVWCSYTCIRFVYIKYHVICTGAFATSIQAQKQQRQQQQHHHCTPAFYIVMPSIESVAATQHRRKLCLATVLERTSHIERNRSACEQKIECSGSNAAPKRDGTTAANTACVSHPAWCRKRTLSGSGTFRAWLQQRKK